MAQPGTLVIGSRGSQLALWQANHVAGLLRQIGFVSQIRIVKTSGDHLQTASLTQAGGKGLFTKEIEEALLNGSIDVAVHSLKDLPTASPAELNIAGIPRREDPRDAIVGSRLQELSAGARVGTSSGRRAAQLLLLRRDLRIEPIRGNVDTRLRKCREGHFDAILLAVSGLRRLGIEKEIAEIFSPEEMCPAAGQGALAIQTRRGDPASPVCAQLDDAPSRQAVACERATLAALGGGCQLPIGVFAEVASDQLRAQAVVVANDGSSYIRGSRTGPAHMAEDLGRQLGLDLIARGANQLISQSAAAETL